MEKVIPTVTVEVTDSDQWKQDYEPLFLLSIALEFGVKSENICLYES